MPGDQSTANMSVVDPTGISESIDRLCNQSVTNIPVPRFDDYADVHDFIAEFERITITLSDEQKLLVLPKAFPVNCYKSWYGTELTPLIESKAPWSRVKSKILSRFSVGEEQDKHFSRLRDLKYDSQAKQSLLAYFEDILYSYQRAHPGSTTADTIKYIKMTLPPSLRAKLNLYSDFKDAQSMDMLKSAAKEFDLAMESEPKGSGNLQSAEQIANILKTVMSEVKKETQALRSEHEASQKELIAAIQAQGERQLQTSTEYNRSRSPARGNNYYRQSSPGPQGNSYRPRSPGYQYANSTRNRGYSPGRGNQYQDSNVIRRPALQHTGEGRPSSPANNFTNQNATYHGKATTPYTNDQRDNLSARSDVIFNPNDYFEKFGRPPGPCPNCKGSHWIRHCLVHLN